MTKAGQEIIEGAKQALEYIHGDKSQGWLSVTANNTRPSLHQAEPHGILPGFSFLNP